MLIASRTMLRPGCSIKDNSTTHIKRILATAVTAVLGFPSFVTNIFRRSQPRPTWSRFRWGAKSPRVVTRKESA